MIFFIFFSNIIVTFAVNLKNTISEGVGVVTWEEKSLKYCLNYSNNNIKEMNILILGVVCLWIRVIHFARYNEYLGRFLTVVQRLISEIILFFVLYLVNLIVFATIAETAFTDLPDYNTLSQAFITLFYASFGTFDFDQIEKSELSKNFAISYLIFFLIINIGLFMSLFVSIVTVLFQVFQKNDRVC